MVALLFQLFFAIPSGYAQDYGEFNDYQSYTDGENYSRHWGFTFAPSFFYLDIEEDNQVTGGTAIDRPRNFMFYDLKLGHVFRRGFYFGIIYSGENQNINDSAPKNSRTSFGLSIGYAMQGWTAMLHYFVHSVQEVESQTAVYSEYNKGSGFQVDLAYHFTLNRYFYLGPMVSYKSMTYREAENSATSVDSDASSSHNVLTPMVSLLILFYR